MGLTSIVGTYDAVVIPILLDRDLVLSFLPLSMKGDLLPSSVVGEALGTTIPDDKHLVTFILGRQSHCGVSMLPGKMSFQEAKLEIPFIRHGFINSDEPHSYKQTLMFDSRAMSIASQRVKGLRSRFLEFDPPIYSSTDHGAITTEAHYSILGALELEAYTSPEASLSAIRDGALKLEESAVKTLLSLPWFGENTRGNVAQFDFDWERASHPLEAIAGTLTFDPTFFSGPGLKARSSETAESPSIHSAISGYRFCAYFTTI